MVKENLQHTLDLDAMRARLCILFLALLWSPTPAHSATVTVNIQEETSPQLVIKLPDLSPVKDFPVEKLNSTRFSILGFSPYFHINSVNGSIYTRKVIDRESVCQPKAEECLLPVNVFVSHNLGYDLVKVNVIIEDIDDNLPVFPQSSVSISVLEGTSDFTLTLPSAVDLDKEENSKTQYQITYDDDNALPGMSLQLQEDAEGSTISLHVTVQEPLDCELVTSFQFELLAFSLSQPHNGSLMRVKVNVEDENDNEPIFEEVNVTISLLESIPLHTVIAQVHATDKDVSQPNSAVSYFLSDTSSPFSIDQDSGDISIIRSLDCEQETRFILTVTAQDHGTPSLSSSAFIYVEVTDVNEYAPVLEVTTKNTNNTLTVSEHSAVKTFIALISTQDADCSSPNHDLDCSIESDLFELVPYLESEFILRTATDIDRELVSQTTVTVRCRDFGEPSLYSQKSITVNIQDINDNSPQFSQPDYNVDNISESSPVGTSVLHVTAIDSDIGDNSKVEYSLLERAVPFHINAATGEVSTAAALDYETQSTFHLKVEAKDQGEPSLSSFTEIHIYIQGVNDHVPRFTQNKYLFEVSESMPSGTIVGQLSATDSDRGIGGTFQFSLEQNNSKCFGINASSGVIYTMREIDRENISEYELTAIVRDDGNISLHSTAKVYIAVKDINDNYPFFPVSQHNKILTVSGKRNSGHVIGQFLASDLDIKDIGKLRYYLIENNGSEGLFNINSANGTILLAKTLPKELSGSYNLTIIACDTRHQCVESDVLISVQSVSSHNYLLLLIIILPLSFSLIFCLACIAAWKTQLLHQKYKINETRRENDVDQLQSKMMGSESSVDADSSGCSLDNNNDSPESLDKAYVISVHIPQDDVEHDDQSHSIVDTNATDEILHSATCTAMERPISPIIVYDSNDDFISKRSFSEQNSSSLTSDLLNDNNYYRRGNVYNEKKSNLLWHHQV